MKIVALTNLIYRLRSDRITYTSIDPLYL